MSTAIVVAAAAVRRFVGGFVGLRPEPAPAEIFEVVDDFIIEEVSNVMGGYLPRPTNHQKRMNKLLELGGSVYCEPRLREMEFPWVDRKKEVSVATPRRAIPPSQVVESLRREGYEPLGISSLLYYGVRRKENDPNYPFVISPVRCGEYFPCFCDSDYVGWEPVLRKLQVPEAVQPEDLSGRRFYILWPIYQPVPPHAQYLVTPKSLSPG